MSSTTLASMLALLAAAAASVAAVNAQPQTTTILTDNHGNLHIKPSSSAPANATVLIDGLPVEQLLSLTAQLSDQVAERDDQLHPLTSTHQGLKRPPSIAVIGGSTGTTTNMVRLYRPNMTDDTLDVVPLPAPLQGAAACLHLSRVFVVGGIDFGATNQVLSYDGNAWRQVVRLPIEAFSAAACSYKGYVYVVGGRARDGPLRSVYRFDGLGWSSAPSMDIGRAATSAVVYENKMVVVGGMSNRGPLASVQAFDGVSWSPLPSLTFERGNAAACVFDGKIFVAAGVDSTGQPVSSVEVFADSRNVQGPPKTWQPFTSLPFARSWPGMAVLAGRLYVLGGEDGVGTPQRTVVALDNDAWVPQKSLPAAVSEAAYVTVFEK